MTRRYGSKTVSKTHNATACMMAILHRENFTDADIASLARSYGVDEARVRGMIADKVAGMLR